MRPTPCGKCGKTVPQMPNDLLDAYARLAAAGHEGARRRGLTLAAMLKVPEATRRQFESSDARRVRPEGLTESEGAEYVAKCLQEGRAPNLDTARAFRDAKVEERTAAVAAEVAKARAEAAARGPPETPAAALPDEPAAAGASRTCSASRCGRRRARTRARCAAGSRRCRSARAASA